MCIMKTKFRFRTILISESKNSRKAIHSSKYNPLLKRTPTYIVKLLTYLAQSGDLCTGGTATDRIQDNKKRRRYI